MSWKKNSSLLFYGKLCLIQTFQAVAVCWLTSAISSCIWVVDKTIKGDLWSNLSTHSWINNSSQNQFTCFYKMFCCFQHFSWSNIVKLIMVLLPTIACFSFYRNGLWFIYRFWQSVYNWIHISWYINNIAMNR